MISNLIDQEVDLKFVAVVGSFCNSCELEGKILQRVQSLNQMPVIAIQHNAGISQKTILTQNPWKSSYITFHLMPFSMYMKDALLVPDRKDRKIFLVINEPLQQKPYLWDFAWADVIITYAYLKNLNIYYMAFLNFKEVQLFTMTSKYNEMQVSIEDDIVQSRMRSLSGKTLQLAQYHNPPFSIIRNGQVYGYDGKFIDVVCKHLKVFYSIIKEMMVSKWPSENQMNSRTKIMNANADFSFNSREIFQFVSMDLNKKLYGTYPLEITRVCAVIPRSKKYSTIRNIINVFDPVAWCAIGIIFAGIGIILFWMTKRSNLFDIYFSLLEIQLLGATSQQRTTIWNKSLTIVFILYNFLILSFLTSVLVAMLTKPIYYPNINTLDELNRSPIRLLTSLSIASEITAIRGKDYLRDDVILTKGSFYDLINIIVSFPNIGFVSTENLIQVFLKSKFNQDSTGEAKYHVVEECYFETFHTYLMNAGNLYEEKVNLYQSWVTEAGLFLHWMRFVKYDFGPPEIQNLYRMTFDDFLVAFYILLFGYGAALVVFLLEIYLEWKGKRFLLVI